MAALISMSRKFFALGILSKSTLLILEVKHEIS